MVDVLHLFEIGQNLCGFPMTYAQVANRVFLSRPLQSDRVQVLQFGILQVKLHDVGMTAGEDLLSDAVGRLEIVRRRMIEIVDERLERVLIGWGTDFGSEPG
jgi:hypothetical protein